MDFNRMNIRNYHIYIKYVNTCNNHIVITNLRNFRKHWIPVSQRDTTMSSWVSPTVLWRKEAETLRYCVHQVSLFTLNQLFLDSQCLSKTQHYCYGISVVCGGGIQFSWISCVTHTHHFVRDALVTHQITSPRNPNNLIKSLDGGRRDY